jgi:hypothetical protein
MTVKATETWNDLAVSYDHYSHLIHVLLEGFRLQEVHACALYGAYLLLLGAVFVVALARHSY